MAPTRMTRRTAVKFPAALAAALALPAVLPTLPGLPIGNAAADAAHPEPEPLYLDELYAPGIQQATAHFMAPSAGDRRQCARYLRDYALFLEFVSGET